MNDRRAPATVVFALTVCAWCGWASGFHRYSQPAAVTWVVSLAVVVSVDLLLWQGRRTRGRRTQGRRTQGHRAQGRRTRGPGLRLAPAERPWPRPGEGGGRRALLGVSPWLGLAVVVLAWEILGIDTGPRTPHLTISALALVSRPLNAALLLVWMLVGFGYGAARARAPLDGPTSPPGFDPRQGVSVAVPGLLLPSSRPVGAAFWVCVAVAAVAAELAARRSGGRLATAEELVRFCTAAPPAKVVAVVAWGFAGYHLFG